MYCSYVFSADVDDFKALLYAVFFDSMSFFANASFCSTFVVNCEISLLFSRLKSPIYLDTVLISSYFCFACSYNFCFVARTLALPSACFFAFLIFLFTLLNCFCFAARVFFEFLIFPGYVLIIFLLLSSCFFASFTVPVYSNKLSL